MVIPSLINNYAFLKRHMTQVKRNAFFDMIFQSVLNIIYIWALYKLQ